MIFKAVVPTLPLDAEVWGVLLDAYLDDATDDQVIAASEAGLEIWPYLIDRQGRLAPTWSGASTTRRIYARTPPVQGIPRSLRGAVSEPGRVVIAADWRGSHLAVLAKGSGDLVLQADLKGDPYAWGSSYGERPKVKVATLAALNGAGPPRIEEILDASGTGKGFLGALSGRWPVALNFLDALREEAKVTGVVETPQGPLEVPAPHKAPAYWLQAMEAQALREVLRSEPPEGLELILALHDETVWLSTPETLDLDLAWVAGAMEEHAPTKVEHGPTWGSLGAEGVGRERPRARASILHTTGRSLRAIAKDPERTLPGAFEVGLMGALEPDRLSTHVSIIETQGVRGKAAGKALRAMGKAGRRLHARAESMVAKASREEVEASDMPLFRKGDQLELGQHLAFTLAPPGLAVHTSEGTRVYDSALGAWDLLDKSDLESKALRYGRAFVEVKQKPTPIHLSANAIAGIAKVARLELHDPHWKGRAGAVAFSNGVLTDDGVLHPHDPSHRVLSEHVFAGDYEAEAPAPAWVEFLGGVFAPDDDADEKISFLQEYIGACVFGRATEYQKHPMLWGPKASNGKSVLVKTVRLLFPVSALASSPPQAWSTPFGKAALLHARMNLITETPDREIVDSGPVKAIMTGDPIEINRKYQDPVVVECRSGHIFAANELPRVTDRSEGFFRRFAMVTFNRVFTTGVDADATLPARLALETTGIMAWAVRGYQRLRVRGHVLPPPSHAAAIETWKTQSGSELAFISAEVEATTDPNRAVPAQVIYDAYRLWCGDQGLCPVSQIRLGKALVSGGFARRRGTGGVRQYQMTLRKKTPPNRPMRKGTKGAS